MILRTGVLGIIFLSMPVMAINGEIRAATKTYDIELTKEDIANQVNATKEFKWDLNGTYPGTAIMVRPYVLIKILLTSHFITRRS